MITNSIGWLDKLAEIVEKYKVGTIIKSLCLIVTLYLLISFMANPTYVFDKYKEWSDKQHTELIEKRMENNAKVHHICERLLFKVEASRVLVLELHNGQLGDGGLPFAKTTATYESVNFDIAPVANQYEGTNLSLIPFASKLFKEEYWCGDTELLKEMDKSLYYKLMSNSTEHFAACIIRGIDKPLALLFVSFNKIPNGEHNCNLIREYVERAAWELALLIELDKNELKTR